MCDDSEDPCINCTLIKPVNYGENNNFQCGCAFSVCYKSCNSEIMARLCAVPAGARPECGGCYNAHPSFSQVQDNLQRSVPS